MSDENHGDGLEFVGLSSGNLTLESLAQALVALNWRFLEEKSKREDLQEQLMSVRDSISKNVKPMIQEVEDQVEQLNNDVGHTFTNIKEIKSAISSLVSTVNILSQENDVLFSQFDKHDARLHVLESQGFIPNSVQTPAKPSPQQHPPPQQQQQQQQQQQSSLFQLTQDKDPVDPATPAKKIYVPKSQRTPAPNSGSSVSQTPLGPAKSDDVSPAQPTPVTPSKGAILDPAAQKLLQRTLLSSLGQRSNVTVANSASNPHDRINKDDRPGVRFYHRAQLLAYKPVPTDTVAFQQQQDSVPPDHFITNLHPEIASKMQQRQTSAETGQLEEQSQDDQNNQIGSLPPNYTVNQNKLPQPLLIAHLPRYLSMDHVENRGSWQGTPRYHSQLDHHQPRPQPQPQYKPTQPHIVKDTSQQWQKASSDEREFLEFKRWKQQQQQQTTSTHTFQNYSVNSSSQNNHSHRHGRSNYNNGYHSNDHYDSDDPYGALPADSRSNTHNRPPSRHTFYGDHNDRNNNNNTIDDDDDDNDDFGAFRKTPKQSMTSRHHQQPQQQFDRFGKPIPMNKVKRSEGYINKMERGAEELREQMAILQNQIEQEGQNDKKNDNHPEESTNQATNTNPNTNTNPDDPDQQPPSQHAQIDLRAQQKERQILKLQSIWLSTKLAEIQSLLNKITPPKVPQFAKEIATILATNDPGGSQPGITNEAQVSAIVHTILNRATKELSMVKLIAELCYLIINDPRISTLVFTPDPQGHYGPLTEPKFPLTFKFTLVLYCQHLVVNYTKLKETQLISRYHHDHNNDHNNDQNNDQNNNNDNGNGNDNDNHDHDHDNVPPDSNSQPPELGDRVAITNATRGRFFLGFLGELWKFGILPTRGAQAGMDLLLSTGDEEDILAMVDFSTSVLPRHLVAHIARTNYKIQLPASFPLDQYIQRFESMKTTRKHSFPLKISPHQPPINYQVSLSLRTKFLIMDFLDLYQKK